MHAAHMHQCMPASFHFSEITRSTRAVRLETNARKAKHTHAQQQHPKEGAAKEGRHFSPFMDRRSHRQSGDRSFDRLLHFLFLFPHAALSDTGMNETSLLPSVSQVNL
mmetsp:Transcript_2037/g.4289  ORF Transcript_2037/g.4289 Transcript_2037/m.4289 type:complete len:108 (-) Transcript_2037:244-567(-)